MQPVYVGESGAAGSSDLFERSTKARTPKYETTKLNWIDEVSGGHVIWIINGLPNKWRLDLETHLIGYYGRYDLKRGPLTNRTDGGENNRGRVQGSPRNAPETRAKLSDAAFRREATIDNQTKANRSAKMSETRKGVKLNHGKAMSQALSGVPKKREVCQWCKEEHAYTPFSRYHGDNCIERPGSVLVTEELQPLFPEEVGIWKTWKVVNKAKHKQINKELEEKRQASVKLLVDWVFKKSKNLNSSKQKIDNLKIWKEVKKQPRQTSRWYPLAFEYAGKWYSVHEASARKLINKEQEK